MFRLENKRALVTGATGGIGGAIARVLHAQGAELVLTGRREEALKAICAELGECARAVPADLADAKAPDALIAEAGDIDILVNNAGHARDNLMVRMKDEDWAEVLELNLTAAFRLSRAALRAMMKARSGRIIAITSVVGATGNPGQANYAAAKAGMIGMTKSLAAEVASRGITVNCVAPGFIATAMTEILSDEQKERLLGAIPGGRFGTPEDVAAAVAFLASDEARYITGQTVHVNGGMVMI